MPVKLLHCLYRNTKNEYKIVSVANPKRATSGDWTYIQGWSERHQHPVTLRLDRIIDTYDSAEWAQKALNDKSFGELGLNTDLPECEFKPLTRTGRASFDVCFTGFSKDKKQELIDLAEANNMIVRTKVTAYLNALCCGNRAGPSKMKKASEQGAFVLTEQQFIDVIETGNISELVET